jgi:glycosyltransferase involved in cell wall biosynthesis
LNLASGQHLADELEEAGIAACALCTPTNLPENVARMPEEHAVLLNIPDSRAEFYGYETLKKVIEAFPDTLFYITRSESPEMYDYPNVVFAGMLNRKEMDRVFDKISIAIRFPEHDGMALSVVESMIKGKTVICNYPVPHTVQANTFEELCEALSSLLSHPVEINRKAHEYAVKNFGANHISAEFKRYLKNLG